MKTFAKFLAVIAAVLAFGGCAHVAQQAYATVYGGYTLPKFHISLAARPAHLAGKNLSKFLVVGSCKEDGANPITCPHNGETIMVQATGRTSGGVTMTGWNWVWCGQVWDDDNDTNLYVYAYGPGPTDWPAVLPTGCAGGACPQWPTTARCSLTGDNPAGAEDWTGHSIVQDIQIAAAIDPDWLGDAPTTIVIATGKPIVMKKSAEGITVGSGTYTHLLPAGNYSACSATVNAKLSGGGNWTGLKCVIEEKGAGTVDRITYAVTKEAAEHPIGDGGYCNVCGTNSPVGLDRE